MAEPARRLDAPMTVAEFLEWDEGGDRRYELVGGRPVAMAPARWTHGILAVRLGSRLERALRPPCTVAAEAGIVPEDSGVDYYVADLAVSCTPPGDRPWVPDPVLVVEILSPSTRGHDRAVKLPVYRDMASIRHIVLVDGERVHVEYWRRLAALEWRVRDLGPGDELVIEELGIRVPLDELYRDLPPARPDVPAEAREGEAAGGGEREPGADADSGGG